MRKRGKYKEKRKGVKGRKNYVFKGGRINAKWGK
jgi:hypothetical protein